MQASLLCPEAGEGTVKMKGRQKILGPVVPVELLLRCDCPRFAGRQANHLLVSILTGDTCITGTRVSGR